MSSQITVRWFIDQQDGNRLKGNIVSGQDRYGRKLVLLDSSVPRARYPLPETETNADVLKDTKPRELGKGVLFVRPIPPPDPAALSRDQARAEMLALIEKEGPVLGDRYIPFERPGWHGTIRGRRMTKSPYDGPLPGHWTYTSDDGGSLMTLNDNAGNYAYRPITMGIVQQHWDLVIVNYTKTVADLGQPASVEPTLRSARITWRDTREHGLTVELDQQRAFAHDGKIGPLRPAKGRKAVVATITMLGGKWVIENEDLARGESYDWTRGTVSYATFDDEWARHLSAGMKLGIAALLRPSLHSPAWHVQNHVAALLQRDAKWNGAVWKEAVELEALLAEPYEPMFVYENDLERIRRERDKIAGLIEQQARFAVGRRDEIIYPGEPVDETADVARMKLENTALLASLDAKIAELQKLVDGMPARQGDRNLYYELWCRLDLLREKLEAFPKLAAGDDKDRVAAITGFLVHRRVELQRVMTIIEHQQTSTDNMLVLFREQRLGITSRLKELREQYGLEP